MYLSLRPFRAGQRLLKIAAEVRLRERCFSKRNRCPGTIQKIELRQLNSSRV